MWNFFGWRGKWCAGTSLHSPLLMHRSNSISPHCSPKTERQKRNPLNPHNQNRSTRSTRSTPSGTSGAGFVGRALRPACTPPLQLLPSSPKRTPRCRPQELGFLQENGDFPKWRKIYKTACLLNVIFGPAPNWVHQCSVRTNQEEKFAASPSCHQFLSSFPCKHLDFNDFVHKAYYWDT